MDFQGYIFLGVGCALSVLSFFLRKFAQRSENMEKRIGTLEVLLAKNEARDSERWKQANKLLEDRREDVIKLFEAHK